MSGEGSDIQMELNELKSNLKDVVHALGFLQKFVESEFGMKFQFQAYKLSSAANQELAKKFEVLQTKFLNDSEAPANKSTTDSLVPFTYSVDQPIQIEFEGHSQPAPSTHGVDETVKQENSDVIKIRVVRRSNQENDESQDGIAGGGEEDTLPSENEIEPEAATYLSETTVKKVPKSKRRKKGTGLNLNNERTRMYLARMKGESYLAATLIQRETGRKQYMAAKPMPARKMKETCTSASCRVSKLRNCQKFKESDRIKIFEEFWKEKDWKQKKQFVCENAKRIFPKRRTKQGDVAARRGWTIHYFLPLKDKRVQVCRNMLMDTLSIGDKTLRNWILQGVSAPPESERPAPRGPTRVYRKKSERLAEIDAKKSKDGSYKCPYCLEMCPTRTDFQTHLAKHMEQFTWSEDKFTRVSKTSRT